MIRLKEVLPSVIVSLGQEGAEKGYAAAMGLHDFLSKYQVMATLLSLFDFLPVNRLTKIFDLKDLDSTAVGDVLTTTMQINENRKTTDGTC